jgi:hypothetical protein
MLFLTLGCTGGNVQKEEASSLAVNKYTAANPGGIEPEVVQVSDYGSKWMVELDAGNTTPAYYVDKGSGDVSITQGYALDIALADTYVNSLYERYSPVTTYFDFDGANYWTIRFVSGGTEILVVNVDSSTESIAKLNKKIIAF